MLLVLSLTFDGHLKQPKLTLHWQLLELIALIVGQLLVQSCTIVSAAVFAVGFKHLFSGCGFGNNKCYCFKIHVVEKDPVVDL